MQTHKWLACILLAAGVACAAWSLTHGQQTSAPPADPSFEPTAASRPAAGRLPRDLAKLSPLQRQMVLSAQRGADWLRRANRADGRFEPGCIPALRVPLEGDHYLR